MKVTLIGRYQWYVTSESRPEMVHLVDFEPTEYQKFEKVGEDKFISRTVIEHTGCSCEAFNMLFHRPCKHQREVILHLANHARLTVEERELLIAALEELCRKSPEVVTEPPKPPEKAITSFKTKRNYSMSMSVNPRAALKLSQKQSQ